MKIKNKLIILFLFILFLFFFNINSFAATSLTDEQFSLYTDRLFNYAEDYVDKASFPYYVVYHCYNDNNLFLYYCADPVVIHKVPIGNQSKHVYFNRCYRFIYDYVGNYYYKFEFYKSSSGDDYKVPLSFR